MTTTTRSVTVTTSQSKPRARRATEGKCQCDCTSCQQTCCQLDCIVQPRFFSGQLLTDQDLNAFLGWAQDKFRLSRYRHGWGVVCGLEARCDPQHSDKVIVGPGYAVDCCGDDIVVCQDAAVDLSGVCRDQTDSCADWNRPLDDTADTPKIQIGDVEIPADRLRIIDLYIRYQTEGSDPQLVMGASACRSSSRCEPTRTRESFTVTWRKATATDPMQETADRWVEAYDESLEVIRRFRLKFPSLGDLSATGDNVRRWLLCWIKEHPLHQFCFLRSQIEDTWILDDFENEAKIARLLFWMVQDYRNAFLRCGCFGCEENNGVPLARIWIQVRDDSNKPVCRVLAVDPYPPYRRPLTIGCWPAPLGKLNLARFIGRRWQEVCRELDDLGVVVSDVNVFFVPNTLLDLESALECDPFVGCADEWNSDGRFHEPRVVELYEFEGFGARVVGICEQSSTLQSGASLSRVSREETDRQQPTAPQPGVSVSKVSREKTAKPGQRVNYLITVRNTGEAPLTLRVEESGITGDVVLDDDLMLTPGASREFPYVVMLPNSLPDEVVTNVVRVTGKTPGGMLVNATATHTIPVSAQRVFLTDISSLSAANAEKLEGEGIKTMEDLAGTPTEKLKAIFPRANAERLKEWINEAKKLMG
jgi:hypothetical protein